MNFVLLEVKEISSNAKSMRFPLHKFSWKLSKMFLFFGKCLLTNYTVDKAHKNKKNGFI
jgi:hypothetical protein